MTTSRESWELSDDEKTLLYFVYEFWLRERRPPNEADIHGATGFGPRETRPLARMLREGFALTFDDERVVLSIDKAPPFSATPTGVACFVDDEFVSYMGCAMEMASLSHLPTLGGVTLTMRSACACCFSPIEVQLRDGAIVGATPSLPVITAIRSPWDFEHGVTPDRVCDSFQVVLDEEHASRFERRLQRVGVRLTMAQAAEIGRGVGESRMRDPHWHAVRLDARTMIEHWGSLGVDVSPWLD